MSPNDENIKYSQYIFRSNDKLFMIYWIFINAVLFTETETSGTLLAVTG